MQVKISQILNLQKLSTKLGELKLPLRLMYRLSKFFEGVEKELEFYRTRSQKIFDEYAEKDEKGNIVYTNMNDTPSVKIKPECIAIVAKLFNELTELEVQLPDFHLTFEEAELLDLSMNEFNALLPFIDIEKEDSN